jgi:hypothetical protein
MNLALRLMLTAFVLVTPLFAAAQGCPPGQYPVAGQGWNYCAPVPGADQGDTAAQTPPPPQWKDIWQATAIDTGIGALGTSTGQSSSKNAERAALLDCQDKGGVACKYQVSVINGCLAMVVGDKTLNTNGGASLDEATRKAMATCNEGDTACHVYYSSCDLPERVR